MDVDSAQKFGKGDKIQKVENTAISKCAAESVLFSANAKSRQKY